MAGREKRTLRDPPLKRVTGWAGIRIGSEAVWSGMSRRFMKKKKGGGADRRGTRESVNRKARW